MRIYNNSYVMLHGLTRREQRILLYLIGIIALGLAIHHFKISSQREISFSSFQTDEGKAKASGLSGDTGDATSSQSSLININTASLDELCSLHGIGEVKAKEIIEYRDTHKGFKTLEEITKVPGIGTSTFREIRDRITLGEADSTQRESKNSESVAPPTPERILTVEDETVPVSSPGKIDINTASLEDLLTLEQIGEIKAQRILDYRRRYGPFHSVKDLLKIRGIGEKTLLLNKDKITVGVDQNPK